jgi:hypothetical protein
MSLPRLCTRLARLEAQAWEVRRRRLAQMTPEELAATFPVAWAWLNTYFDAQPEAELDAIIRKDPEAERRLLTAWHQQEGGA